MPEVETTKMHPQDKRRPYTKPELTKVALRPEEAVLGACKAVGGTIGGGQLGTCSTLSCQSQGS